MKQQTLRIAQNAVVRCKAKYLVAVAIAFGACLLTGCKTDNPATVIDNRDFPASMIAKPAIIYVADFKLGAQNIKHEDGMLSGGREWLAEWEAVSPGHPATPRPAPANWWT